MTGYSSYTSMKASESDWLGEIPSHWTMKRLWHLTPPDRRIMYGIVLPGPDVNGGVPIVKGGDVAADRLSLDRLSRTSAEIEAGYVRSRLRGGDLVYAIRGSIGEVAMVPEELTGANLTQDAARISYTSDLSGQWLLYALKAPEIFAQLEAGALGATITGINIRDLKRALIPVPPVEEQRAIAAFLDRETAKIDALVAKKRRLIELLQEERAARIMRAVTMGIDADPSTRRTDVPWLPRVPARWKVEKLGWHTDCLDGRRIPLNAEERAPMRGDYPYWGANSIVDYVDKWLFDEDLVLLGEDGAPFFDRTRPVAFHVRGRIWVNNHAHVLRARESLDPGFLAHVLNCVEYRTFIDGSTRDKLTQGDMNRIPIQIPPLAEQMQIRSSLDEGNSRIDSVLTRIGEGIERLNELRASLISAAVTGKIDVRGEAA